jgi:hypothetical protein
VSVPFDRHSPFAHIILHRHLRRQVGLHGQVEQIGHFEIIERAEEKIKTKNQAKTQGQGEQEEDDTVLLQEEHEVEDGRK